MKTRMPLFCLLFVCPHSGFAQEDIFFHFANNWSVPPFVNENLLFQLRAQRGPDWRVLYDGQENLSEEWEALPDLSKWSIGGATDQYIRGAHGGDASAEESTLLIPGPESGEDNYTDFRIYVEFFLFGWPDSNSGINFRFADPPSNCFGPAISKRLYQVEWGSVPPENPLGPAETGSLEIVDDTAAGMGNDPPDCSFENIDLRFFAVNLDGSNFHPLGWNSMLLEVIGESARVYLNGFNVNESDELVVRPGRIGFQLHANMPEMEIHIRRVEIQSLD